jgi:hypothetical protein
MNETITWSRQVLPMSTYATRYRTRTRARLLKLTHYSTSWDLGTDDARKPRTPCDYPDPRRHCPDKLTVRNRLLSAISPTVDPDRCTCTIILGVKYGTYGELIVWTFVRPWLYIQNLPASCKQRGLGRWGITRIQIVISTGFPSPYRLPWCDS